VATGLIRAGSRPPDAGATSSESAARGARPWRRLAPVGVFLAVAVAVIGWHMVKYPYLSPIDENAQFDYIRIAPRIPSGTLSQDTLRLTACRGYSPSLPDRGLATYTWPPCRSKHFDPAVFPGGGLSTAGTTAPLYYYLTAVVTRPFAFVAHLPLLNVVRAVNVFWLTGLMMVSYLIARRVRAPRAAAMAAAVVVGTSSDVVTSAATAGPDTATAVTGGLVILAALAYDGTRRSTALLLAAVAVASVTKLTVFTAVGAAMVILLARALLDRHDPPGRDLRRVAGVTAAIGAIFTVASLAWFLRPGSGASSTPTGHVSVPWRANLSALLFNFLPPNYGNFDAEFLEGLFNTRLEGLMAGLLVVSMLAAALAGRTSVRACALGWGVALMAITGPVILTELNALAYDMFMPLPSRYGYGLLAGFAALLAWTCRGKARTRALILVAAVSFLSVFV
jgi:hypothetical protein